MPKKSFLILGAGSWGTALAILLARNEHQVHLWGHNLEQMKVLCETRSNPFYLPDILFPKTLIPFVDLEAAIKDIDHIVIAVPSQAVKQVLNRIKPFLNKNTSFILASKGIDAASGKLLHQVIAEETDVNFPIAVLSGPSFAKEVAKGLPTAVTIASHQKEFLHEMMSCFASNCFRTYATEDVIGVEIAGACKNIIAIAVGVCDGLQMGANARSALITRGLAEIVRLGITLGGKQETFLGLAGIGDLILTCTDNQSRNRRFGLYLGEGLSIEEAYKKVGQVVEGAANAKQIYQLAQQHSVEMPIIERVYSVINENVPVKEAVMSLMSRQVKM